MTSICDDLAVTMGWTAARVAATSLDDLSRPTPCSEWDVQALLSHLVGGNIMYALGTQGVVASADDLHGDLLKPDPTTAYQLSADRALAGWRSADLDGTVTLTYGTMPASFSIRTHLMDHLLHGWDLAVATGQSRDAPGHLVALVEKIVDELPHEITDNPKVFATARSTPVGASRFDQLAARCGRSISVGTSSLRVAGP